jgi:hypothetical protein
MVSMEEIDRAIREAEESDERMKKYEDEGVKNILKYFDRIHDKLFTFNNILIGGFFALPKIDKSAPVASIIIPLLNLAFLIYVEYRMMEKSRFESEIRKYPLEKIQAHGKVITRTNLYSLWVIGTTSIVTGVFLYYLLKI